jgi:hypothetical protein
VLSRADNCLGRASARDRQQAGGQQIIRWAMVLTLIAARQLGVLHRGRAVDPPRRHWLGTDRGPSRGEGRTAREAPSPALLRSWWWARRKRRPRQLVAGCTSRRWWWVADGAELGRRTRRARAANARPTSRLRYRWHVWCKACRHATDADLAALVADGRGDVPLVQMKWRCGNCCSRLTEFIVGGSLMRPGNAELLTGIESASSRPVRPIVLIGGQPKSLRLRCWCKASVWWSCSGRRACCRIRARGCRHRGCQRLANARRGWENRQIVWWWRSQ